jgi:hypothetical protein
MVDMVFMYTLLVPVPNQINPICGQDILFGKTGDNNMHGFNFLNHKFKENLSFDAR